MLELNSIQVNYGAAVALRDVSLRIDAGELVCVVGPNGAGKTTLINAIAGINRIASGSIRLEGCDLARLPPHAFCAQGLALVPEGRRLFTSMTVRENLELGSYVDRARSQRHASIERVCALFPVLTHSLNRAAGVLSGGQQQMLAIARALMARPKLLLLDEPSLGLAPLIVLDLFRIIQQVHAEGIAVLLVEQNVATALEIATRAYVLDEGRIVAEGEPDTLLSRPQLRRAYLGIGGDEQSV